MKNQIFLFLLLFILISCTETKEPKPEIILTEDKMVDVLIDLHQLEAATLVKNLPQDSAMLIYKLYERDIFNKHAISDSTYYLSLNYYSGKPEIMLPIYERVVDSLSWLEENRPRNKGPQRDSLRHQRNLEKRLPKKIKPTQ